jgi:hypothetical protein
MGLLLGHQEGTHNYRIWDGNKVIITRDVIFPIISGDDFQNSGDDIFSARIGLSKRDRVSDYANYVPTDFQPDSIKTAVGTEFLHSGYGAHILSESTPP